MSDRIADALKSVFTETLERYAFMFADDPADDDTAGPSGTLCGAGMRFSGPWCGAMQLVLPETLLGELAANILDIDAEDPEAPRIGEDSLKELLNVTCGQFLTHVSGSGAVFELTIPTTRTVTGGEWLQIQSAPHAIRLDIESMPVLVHVCADGDGVIPFDEGTEKS